MNRFYGTVESELGTIYIVIENDLVSAVHIGDEDFQKHERGKKPIFSQDNELVEEAVQQMEDYFSNRRKRFDLPLQMEGTEFQTSVWKVLYSIPFGTTYSYQEVAEKIGNSKAVRAIGQANKANKLPIIIPCHRVIGKNMKLTGYAGTRTDIKEKLLTLEGAGFKQ
ncbi:methylated-DNA--[protein]-cysteine S-methyltransferase [Robertmurraya korlensis]|uniref:methylated-DNA--[protein]-cysteine S-methyltransferase n=1 Tax=Robertmurraya korlensis TaxID=519977 RepID=UPI0008246676|nr:methylated-DNA--[protein]-cysteine S-methyltransferase [Robertmurraya korlensis]